MMKSELSIIMQKYKDTDLYKVWETCFPGGDPFDAFLEELLPIAKEIYKETRRKTTRHMW